MKKYLANIFGLPTNPRHRSGERGNIFFTLFGAIALVGVVGVATTTLMRGPVGTVMTLNQRAKADSQLEIARKLAGLEAARSIGDCDSDNFIEPAGPDTATAGCSALPGSPNNMGCLPAVVGADKSDPWGTLVGYCSWDHGSSYNTCGGGAVGALEGEATQADVYNKPIITVVSAGADRTFQTDCVDDPGAGAYVTTPNDSDDIVFTWTYDAAAEGVGDGLWELSSGDPNSITSSRDVEISNDARFTSGTTATFEGTAAFGTGSLLDFTGGGLLDLPTQATSGACNGANDGMLRILENSPGAGDRTLQMCDGVATWLSIGGSAVSAFGNNGDIQFNDNGVLNGATGLNWDGTDFTVPNGLDVNGTSDLLALNAQNTDITGTLGVSALSTLADVNAANIDSTTLDTTGAVTIGTTLGVTGLSTLADVNAANIDSTTLDTTGAATIGTTLGVTGLSTLADVNADDIDSATLDTTGAVTIGTTLGVTGLSTLADVDSTTLDTTGAVTVGTTLEVTGQTDLDGRVLVSSTLELLDFGAEENAACTNAGALSFDASEDELLVCSDDTGTWETIGTSGGGGGGTGGRWSANGATGEIFYNLGGVGIGVTDPDDAYAFDVAGAVQMSTDLDVGGAGGFEYTAATDNFRIGNGVIGGTYSVLLGNASSANGTSAIALGNSASVSANYGVALGQFATSTAINAVSIGKRVRTSGANSFGFGIGTSSGTAANFPEVSGADSFGIFMGDQADVEVTADNIMALLGGRLVIDPNEPATETNVSGVLDLDVEGEIGAIQYCNEDGAFCVDIETIVSGGTGVFEDAGNIIRATSGIVQYASADFVFGSPDLDDIGGETYDNSRIIFDKSQGSFRAGTVLDTRWDEGSRGNQSAAFGHRTEASGDQSMAWGLLSTATATQATAWGGSTASNTQATSWGAGTAASGVASTTWGSGTTATASQATAWGSGADATSFQATAWGFNTTASGREGTAWGGVGNAALNGGTASGAGSTAFGAVTTANGILSTAWGREVIVNGDYSTAIGLQSTTHSTLVSPRLTGDRSMVLFFDGGVADANTGYSFTDNDKFALVGGEFQIGETFAQGSGKGCIRFEEGTNRLQFSHDCSSYNDLGDSAGISAPGNNREIIFNSGDTFFTDTNFVFSSAGNLGVGDSNPDAVLSLVGVSDPSLRIRETGTSASYFEVRHNGPTQTLIQTNNAGAGSALIDVNPQPSDGVSNSAFRLFRATNTTGGGAFSIHEGDGSGLTNHYLSTGTISYLASQATDNLGVGDTTPDSGTGGQLKLDVEGNIGGTAYCDADGNNCFTAAGIAASTLWEDVGGGGAGPIRSTSGTVDYSAADFVFGSPSLDDIGGTDDDGRFFFDKSSSAFRAGNAPGTTWDSGSIGSFSAAFGYNTTASNNNAMAWGINSDASGIASTAWGGYGAGFNAGGAASGISSTAFGHDTTATASVSTAWGSGADATASGATAWGNNTTASGQYATASGNASTASGDNSFATGWNTTASGAGSMTWGHGVGGGIIASGTGSTAWGFSDIFPVTASGQGSTAWGFDNVTASGDWSTAFGGGTTASGNFATAWGNNTDATVVGATAWGDGSNATGDYSTAWGAGATTQNIASGEGATVWGGASVAMQGTEASGAYSTAFGSGVEAEGAYSVAIGLQSAPLGTKPKVSGDRSMALFFDSNTGSANSNYDLTETDKFALIGGDLLLGEKANQGSAKGCIRFEPASDKLQFAHDCSTYADFGSVAAGAGIWEDVSGTGAGPVRPTTGTINYASADFVFGSPQLNDDTNTDHDSRMFFDKSQGAFRAGTVTDGQWDVSNIASGSAAFGYNTTAEGNHSTAFGYQSTASGGTSTAFGSNTIASGNDAVAWGAGADATATGATAWGNNTEASGQYATALGSSTTASGDYSIAAGFGNVRADGDSSFALGYHGGPGAVTANGLASVAQGVANGTSPPGPAIISADGDGSSALGYAFGNSRILAAGRGSNVWGTTAAGDEIRADGIGATSFGHSSWATGDYSLATGVGVNVTGDHSVGFGLDDTTTGGQVVSGVNSMGIFMGNQNGIDVTGDEIVAVLGGRMIINPEAPTDTTVDPDTALHVVGDVTFTGYLSDISDRRLKTDIQMLRTDGSDSLLEKIRQVDTYSFRMKDEVAKYGDAATIEYGVMAQELEQIFPKLVNTASDEMGTKSVSYLGLIAPMIEATKELADENDRLKAELAAKDAAVDARLAALEMDMKGVKAHTGYGISKAMIGGGMTLLMIIIGGIGFMFGRGIVTLHRKES